MIAIGGEERQGKEHDSEVIIIFSILVEHMWQASFPLFWAFQTVERTTHLWMFTVCGTTCRKSDFLTLGCNTGLLV